MDRARLLLVGGGAGFVGHHVVRKFSPQYSIRSVHRHRSEAESETGIEWVGRDVGEVLDWTPLLEGIDVVLTVAWYRWESERAFRKLRDGLLRLVAACRRDGRVRFLQMSVPAAPEPLESRLPYLSYKRTVDRTVEESGLSYAIVRPTLLYGAGDRLFSAMLRVMRRYGRFPMFGEGEYHVSPVAVSDLARILLREAGRTTSGTRDVGGPERFVYRDLTDRMFRALGLPPRYWRMSRASAIRLTRWMTRFGSTLLHPYEVEWLMSDRLGLPTYAEFGGAMQTVGPYLDAEAKRLAAV